jgi:hypothetical protein
MSRSDPQGALGALCLFNAEKIAALDCAAYIIALRIQSCLPTLNVLFV